METSYFSEWLQVAPWCVFAYMRCDLITKWVQDTSPVLQIVSVGKEVTFELITLSMHA